MKPRRKRASRRRIYWIWKSHLDSGHMTYLMTRKPRMGWAYSPCIRVRITVLK